MAIDPTGTVDMAAVVAAVRMRELRRDKPLFRDEVAARFVGDKHESDLDAINANIEYFENMIAVRYRVIWDEVRVLIGQHPRIRQIISLGCGYCVALDRLRNEFQGRFRSLVEIDNDEVILDRKRQVLGKRDGITSFVLNLQSDAVRLESLLESHGLDTSEPTIFVGEGVLYYFESEAMIDSFLDVLSGLIRRSSSIFVFDMQVGDAPSSHILKGMMERRMNTIFLSAAQWCKKFEANGLVVKKFANVAALDRWNRLATDANRIRSSVFTVHAARAEST
jgi:O-methyltransferase involved in polyketide biosynthesis